MANELPLNATRTAELGYAPKTDTELSMRKGAAIVSPLVSQVQIPNVVSDRKPSYVTKKPPKCPWVKVSNLCHVGILGSFAKSLKLEHWQQVNRKPLWEDGAELRGSQYDQEACQYLLRPFNKDILEAEIETHRSTE